MAQRRVVILGSTGSIGRQALQVVEALPERLRVVGLAARGDAATLLHQVEKHRPEAAGLLDPSAAAKLRAQLDSRECMVLSGVEGLEELAALKSADIVVTALLGAAGLRPTVSALLAGKDLAIANKETLVAAGSLVTRLAERQGVSMLPVDSEHSAVHQCLRGEDPASVRRLILTASGGPFVDATLAELDRVTSAEALIHPTWQMGSKITIDSATLMNKGLEVIEAHWLFGLPPEQIEVLIHRQSIIHSMVEFNDGSVKAQMGVPDMRLPIQYALLYPERVPGCAPKLNLLQSASLTFEQPDEERFGCLRLAREAAAVGGTMPAVMNAANEVAVQAFLEGAFGFMGIPELIEEVMGVHEPVKDPDLQAILAADSEARRSAKEALASRE